jgi:hypothetical protein
MIDASILSAIDAEIASLQQVRKLLSGRSGAGNGMRATTKRTLSPEARAKIASAQKKRWAAAKKK